MSKTNIMADLDKLVKRAAAVKAEALKPAVKVASIGDGAKDGLTPATTGAQAASNAAASKDRVETAMVDGAAKDNAAGKSLEAHNSDGVSAVDVSGQAGAKGAVLAPTSTEPLTSQDAMKTASALVAQLRKAAETANKVDASVTLNPSEGVTAVKKDGQAGAKGAVMAVKKTEGREGGAEALAKSAGIRAFLAKVAMSLPAIKTAAEAEQMGEEQVGDAAAEDLIQKLESGQVSEEEAQKILEEAVASGAISEEDVTGAMAEAQQGQGGEQAPQDPAMQDPAMQDPAMQVDPAAMAADPKLAAAACGPDHPQYIEKLKALHTKTAEVGYAFAIKLAEEIGAEEKKEDAAHEGGETEKEEKDEHAIAAASPEEQAALAQAQQELGLSDEDLAALAAAPAKTASLVDKYRVAILNKVAAYTAAK